MTKTHHTPDNQPSARNDRLPIKPGKYLVGYLHLWHFCVLLGFQRKQNRYLAKNNNASIHYKHLGSGSAHYFEVLQHFMCSAIHLCYIFINMLMCQMFSLTGKYLLNYKHNLLCLPEKKSALLNTTNYLVQNMAGRGFEQQGTGLVASSCGALTKMFVEAVLPWVGCREITGGCTSHARASRGNIPTWKSPEQIRCFWRMKDTLWEQPDVATTLRRFCSTSAGTVPGALSNGCCPGDWWYIPNRLSNFYHHLHVSGRQRWMWEHGFYTADWGCSSGIQKGFNHSILLSFPICYAMLSWKAEHVKVLQTAENRDLQVVVNRTVPQNTHTD